MKHKTSRWAPNRWSAARRLSLIIAAAILTGLAFAAANTSAAGAPPKLKHGGTLNFVVQGLSPSFDSSLLNIASTTDGPLGAAIYGQLCSINPKTAAVQMSLAQSITPSKNQKVWTLTLHPGMKFSDGTPFNAAAVAFTIQRDADPATASPQQAFASTLSVKVLSATKLQITLPAPNSHFDGYVCQDFPFIGSPTAIQSEGASFGTHPVGGGPFMFESFFPGVSLTLDKNPYYSRFAKGQPFVDKLVLTALSATTQAEAAISSGTAQAGSFSGSAVQIGNDLKSLPGISIIHSIVGGGGTIIFNESSAPFDDLRARKAVSLALDRKQLADTRSPETPPVWNLFPATSPYYSGKFGFAKQNKTLAQQLFNQLAAAGKPVKFALTIPSQAQFLIHAAAMQSELAAFDNVSMTVNALPAATYLANVRSGNYQAASQIISFVNPYPALINGLITGGSTNYYHWSNAKVDKALLDAQSTSSKVKQVADWKVVQTEFNKDFPIFLTTRNDFMVPYRHDLIGGVATNTFGNVPEWGKIGFLAS